MQPLAKSLGVRVVPTFKLFRNKEIVAEIAGAKYDELLAGGLLRFTMAALQADSQDMMTCAKRTESRHLQPVQCVRPMLSCSCPGPCCRQPSSRTTRCKQARQRYQWPSGLLWWKGRL